MPYEISNPVCYHLGQEVEWSEEETHDNAENRKNKDPLYCIDEA